MSKSLKNRGPRRKRMDRAARLQSALSTQWVRRYGGKHVLRAYGQYFGVDPLCAFIELTALGVAVPPEQRPKTRDEWAGRPPGGVSRKQSQEETEGNPDSHGTFAFIAGHTTAGFPYGVTWAEAGRTPPWAWKRPD